MMQLSLVVSKPVYNCKLPFGCEINNIHYPVNFEGYEKTSIDKIGILCDVRNEEFQFNYPMQLLNPNDSMCEIDSPYSKESIDFRFHSNFILGQHFNFTNMLDYLSFLRNDTDASFISLKGFELDFINYPPNNRQNTILLEQTQTRIPYFDCVKCKIEFYSNRSHLKTCQDIIDSYSGRNVSIRSLFQTTRGNIIVLLHSDFKTALCPLVFMNSNISTLLIVGLSNTFYKRNILNIENRTFDNLNSNIESMQIGKTENINVDSNLLNPSVFRNLMSVYFTGPINMIDGNSFKALENLKTVSFSKEHYKDIIHKNGIEWMRVFNEHLDVDLSNFTQLEENYYKRSHILISRISSGYEIRLSKILPDEDFCLYKDFPFNQLVVLMEYSFFDPMLKFLNLSDYTYYSCTYLWLTQHFNSFLEINER